MHYIPTGKRARIQSCWGAMREGLTTSGDQLLQW